MIIFQVHQCMIKILLVSATQLIHRIGYPISILLLNRNLMKEDKHICSKRMKCYTHFGKFKSIQVNY